MIRFILSHALPFHHLRFCLDSAINTTLFLSHPSVSLPSLSPSHSPLLPLSIKGSIEDRWWHYTALSQPPTYLENIHPVPSSLVTHALWNLHALLIPSIVALYTFIMHLFQAKKSIDNSFLFPLLSAFLDQLLQYKLPIYTTTTTPQSSSVPPQTTQNFEKKTNTKQVNLLVWRKFFFYAGSHNFWSNFTIL